VAQGMLGVVERLLPVMQRLGVSIDSCNHFKQVCKEASSHNFYEMYLNKKLPKHQDL